MQYTYRIKERKPGEPPISIVEITDQEPGDYVTISFGEHKQVTMESDTVKIPVRILTEIKPDTIIENRGGKAYLVRTV